MAAIIGRIYCYALGLEYPRLPLMKELSAKLTEGGFGTAQITQYALRTVYKSTLLSVRQTGICLFVCFSINCHSEYFDFESINIWFYTIYFWCKLVYFCNFIH